MNVRTYATDRRALVLLSLLGALSGAVVAPAQHLPHESPIAELTRTSADFDEFLNSFLVPPPKGLRPFEKASDVGRAFDAFMIANGFASMSVALGPGTTPFQRFADYNKRPRPVVRESWLRSTEESHKPVLAQVGRVVTKRIDSSIILCESDVDNRTTSLSILIAGGDVRIKNAECSMVFAAGDVTLASGTADVLVIAGGKITIAGSIGNYVLVTPERVEVVDPRFLRRARNKIVHEGSRRPAPELFRFAALADYGIKAASDKGRIRVLIVRKDSSPFHDVLKEQDIIINVAGKPVDSVGQFRRLMSHAVRIGRLDADVERSGQQMRVQSALYKQVLPRNDLSRD